MGRQVSKLHMRHGNPTNLGFCGRTEVRHKEALYYPLCCKFRLSATEAYFWKTGNQPPENTGCLGQTDHNGPTVGIQSVG